MKSKLVGIARWLQQRLLLMDGIGTKLFYDHDSAM
jgi:hypothetical protein